VRGHAEHHLDGDEELTSAVLLRRAGGRRDCAISAADPASTAAYNTVRAIPARGGI
jgi:hypothetical protein